MTRLAAQGERRQDSPPQCSTTIPSCTRRISIVSRSTTLDSQRRRSAAWSTLARCDCRAPRTPYIARMVDLANEKYVSLTTFRRNGAPVTTPVWIAPLGESRYAFTTDPSSGKVKRVRNNPSVELRPCTMRGKVAPDAPMLTGTALVVTDPADYRPVVDALKRKYGLQVTLIEWGGSIKQLIKRNPDADCALIITLT
jgi:uncharacterized protein